MSALVKEKLYSPEEYLASEENAEYRSEYIDGLIYQIDETAGNQISQMAGATERHIDITLNITTKLRETLRGKCKTFASEMKVRVDEVNRFYYPDITVVFGEREFYQNRIDTIINPILLIEVLSKRTEANDRGDKFIAYQTIESLEEYVLVSQDKYLVEQYTKQDDGSWKYLATIGIDSEVTFESVETTIELKDIYDLVEFEEN